MKCTLFVLTEWALRGRRVAPKFHHVRSFYRVDLRVENKCDDLWSRPVDEVMPREIKRTHIVPMCPDTLVSQLRGMSDSFFFFKLAKDFSCFWPDFRKTGLGEIPVLVRA